MQLLLMGFNNLTWKQKYVSLFPFIFFWGLALPELVAYINILLKVLLMAESHTCTTSTTTHLAG
jgi:hypothetical protein